MTKIKLAKFIKSNRRNTFLLTIRTRIRIRGASIRIAILLLVVLDVVINVFNFVWFLMDFTTDGKTVSNFQL
jgi:hypothetical protein